MKYQRAFEAVLWSLPAVANYRFRMAGFSHLGFNDNVIVAYSGVTPKSEGLTANVMEPYIGACTNLKRGPVVLEVPAAGPMVAFTDGWSMREGTIAEIGPSDG